MGPPAGLPLFKALGIAQSRGSEPRYCFAVGAEFRSFRRWELFGKPFLMAL